MFIFANETCPNLEHDVLLLVGRFISLPLWMERETALHKQKALFDYNTFSLDFIGIPIPLFLIRSSNICQQNRIFLATNCVIYRCEISTTWSLYFLLINTYVIFLLILLYGPVTDVAHFALFAQYCPEFAVHIQLMGTQEFRTISLMQTRNFPNF